MDFLYFLQQHHHPFFDVFFEIISKLVDKTGIFIVICVLYWCFNKKYAHKIAVGFLFSGIFVQSLKIILRIPRPWILDSRLEPSEEMLETATGYSCPSGHTQTATSLCYSLLDFVKTKWVRILLFTFPFLMMLSRMYVLVHSPLDVTLSFVLTASIVILTMKYINKDHDKHLTHISIAMIILSILSLIYSYIIVSNGTTPYELAEDSVKLMAAALGFALGYLFESRYVNFEPSKDLKENIIIFIIGLIGALFFNKGLALFIPDGVFSDFIRYFMTLLWILGLYPYLFTKYTKK